MISRFHFLTLLVASATAVAQVKVDSAASKTPSARQALNAESAARRLAHSYDSADMTLHAQSYGRIDSIRLAFNNSADSIKTQYQNELSAIDGQRSKMDSSIDSIQRLGLGGGKYTKTLDSLDQLRSRTHSRFSSRLDGLKAKTIGKLDALALPAEYKEPLVQLTRNLNKLEMNTDVIKIPDLDVSGFSVPKIEGGPGLTDGVDKLGKVQDEFSIAQMQTPAGRIGQVSQQAKLYQEDIKNITKGNLNDVKALPESIEAQATKIDGMQELQKQSGAIQGYKSQLEELQKPDAVKNTAAALGKKAAVDHFAGKKEQLKAAMDKVSEYKQKFPSASSIKDLPKRPPNAMKGKPLVERLVPGLYFQYQRKGLYLFDVNPYLGYKISGRFTAGLGWNHRYLYNKDSRSFSSHSRIYGPRAYVDVALGKGFIAHLEGETMNAFVPSTLIGNPDTGQRESVWSLMTGLKKEYRIYKNLKGTALIQYNWFNRHYKAPYVDRLNSRIGFEYRINRRSGKNKFAT